ncbi:MAG TPA: ferritin-like domain-containing protein [Acidimicrobiales bacterium]|nr:ferritin-like domain-containing protein [Acidimicrobiales bacterium]
MTPPLSRRAFLLGAGAALAATACTGRSGEGSTAARSPDSTAAAGDAADLDLAAEAAGLEVAAVDAYTAIAEATKAGRLGDVPGAAGEFLAAAGQHHRHLLDAWNQVLVAGHRPKVVTPAEQVKPTVDTRLARARTLADAAAVARTVEEKAAATYLAAVPALRRADLVTLAGSMQAAAAGRAATLSFLLGEYPAPDTFAKTDDALRR